MACRVKGMTVHEYRASYDYRSEYFKRNPGLFGCIWFCSLCHKPLFGRKMVEVDHIRPLNKGGRNHVSNCTACCVKCNRAKSDKVDSRMYKEYAFKIFESATSSVNRGVGGAALLGVGLLSGAVGTTAKVGTAGARGAVNVARRGVPAILGLVFRAFAGVVGLCARIVLFPLTKGSFMSRLIFLIIYTLVLMHYGTTYTDVFNAWL